VPDRTVLPVSAASATATARFAQSEHLLNDSGKEDVSRCVEQVGRDGATGMEKMR